MVTWWWGNNIWAATTANELATTGMGQPMG
jgi:hypothetical protein